jgi:diguanylate cyclase (GGDEF)-like protein/PAS domain S-box-containing protein
VSVAGNKMNERVATDAEGILIAALEQVADAVVVVDTTDCVVLFNAAAERLWGSDRTQILGQPVRQCLPQLVGGGLAAVRRQPAMPSTTSEIQIHRVDGTQAVAAASVSRLKLGDRTVFSVIARDITGEARNRGELHLLSLASDETDRVVVITDADRKVVYVNRAFTEMFGFERHEVIGRSSRDVFASRAMATDVFTRLRHRVDAAKPFHEELNVRDKAGRNIWVHIAVNPVLDEQGGIVNTVAVISNITEGKQLQLLQRDVLEAVAGDLLLPDVMQLICERVEAVAPGVICSVLAVENGLLRPLAAPSMPPEVGAAIDGLAIGPKVGSCGTAAWRGEPVTVTDIDTDPLWDDFRALVLPLGLHACWSSPIKLRDGTIAGTFAFYFREHQGPTAWHEQIVATCVHLCVLAIERQAAKDHIARLAFFDTLTGLPNRVRLRDIIRERIACDPERRTACLFLDLDRFKDVNDTLGHSMGDRLLVEIARRLQRQLRPQDVVSRYGGDEFVLVISDCDHAGGGQLAGKLIDSLLAPVVIDNMLLPVSASIGICVYPADGRDEDTLLKHADTAMYEAKSAGGSAYRFFRPEMNGLAQERLVLGAALREAIVKRQLRLHYQPQIDCSTGALCGAEALARWTHPIFGEVAPSRFIPLAEACGLIEAIGQWALSEACGQLAAWHRAGIKVPTLSVNLSAVHFRNVNLTPLIAQTLERHGLKPEMLTVEITEGVIMDDNPVALETAKAIHELGVRLSLDDFGTGYSSLSYLARLPIDELKIDRSFMKDLDNDRNAQAVVTAVVKIGQSLGVTVVAEGVEARSQQRFLEVLKCDVLQGYLISRALSADDFERWYANYAGANRVLQFPGAA